MRNFEVGYSVSTELYPKSAWKTYRKIFAVLTYLVGTCSNVSDNATFDALLKKREAWCRTISKSLKTCKKPCLRFTLKKHWIGWNTTGKSKNLSFSPIIYRQIMPRSKDRFRSWLKLICRKKKENTLEVGKIALGNPWKRHSQGYKSCCIQTWKLIFFSDFVLVMPTYSNTEELVQGQLISIVLPT